MSQTRERGLSMLAPHAWVAEAKPYRAGTRAPSGPGNLAQNEIPFVSRAAMAAIAEGASAANRYPDPLATRLRERLAAIHAVDPDQILVGGGSDEFLFLIAAAFGGPGRVMCCAEPPYWGHEHPALMSGATVVKVPLRDYRHNLADMARVEADIAFICNPHNPTGTVVSSSDLTAFVSASTAALVVVDEAYLEFVDDPDVSSAIPLVERGNVAVLRTFSKYYGLAGARIGYVVASTDLISVLRTVRAPFSVNQLAQDAALAALDDVELHSTVGPLVRRNRMAMAEAFRRAGHPSVASQTNFLLVECPGFESQLVDRLLAAGVAVRPGTNLGLSGTIRVTVPDDDGLALLEAALTTLDGGNREDR